jgi:hypothetical protein
VEELSALPTAELAARLAEACRLIAELTVRVQQLGAAGPPGFIDVVAACLVGQPV